jgi:hypothetical protein
MLKLHEKAYEIAKRFPSVLRKIEQYVEKLWEKIRSDPSYIEKIKSFMRRENVARLNAEGIFKILCIKLGLHEKILERQYKIVEEEYKRCEINESEIPLYLLVSLRVDYGKNRIAFNPEINGKRESLLKLVKIFYPRLYREIKTFHDLCELSAMDEKLEDLLEKRMKELFISQRGDVEKFLKRLGAEPETFYEVFK